MEFAGTVLVVSHDRSFLDNVATSTLVFEPSGDGTGTVKEYVGGYSDWLRQRPQAAAAAAPPPKATPDPGETRRKRSFKQQRELASLPPLIETLEKEMAARRPAEPTRPCFSRGELPDRGGPRPARGGFFPVTPRLPETHSL